jgi:hypothetical protein
MEVSFTNQEGADAMAIFAKRDCGPANCRWTAQAKNAVTAY